MIIKLPYPDMSLSPNRKNGKKWQATKNAKINQRDIAYYETLNALKGVSIINREKIALKLVYMQSDNRHRDLDNLLSASKALIDGMAKAMGVNDKIFEPITLTRGNGEKCLMVIIE